MLHILQHITKWLDWLERIITAIAGGILGLLVLLVGWQVVGRYVLRIGLFWADELTVVAMMWAALIGAAGCIWTDSHIRLKLILEWLPEMVRVWLLTLMDGVIVGFAYLITKEGIKLIQRTMGGSMSALKIPIGTTYYVLPGAAILMIMFASVTALNRIARYYKGKGGER
jgi:TRAP-type C4-dicarboxylate transport system permease small subunit